LQKHLLLQLPHQQELQELLLPEQAQAQVPLGQGRQASELLLRHILLPIPLPTIKTRWLKSSFLTFSSFPSSFN
jgi:hypothetical protein